MKGWARERGPARPQLYTYECPHNCYLTSSLDSETLARIPCISVTIRYSKCRRSHEIQRIKKIAQLFNHSATSVLLDDVCVDGNMSKYYNVLKLVEQ
jgi:hypothetical protein